MTRHQLRQKRFPLEEGCRVYDGKEVRWISEIYYPFLKSFPFLATSGEKLEIEKKNSRTITLINKHRVDGFPVTKQIDCQVIDYDDRRVYVLPVSIRDLLIEGFVLEQGCNIYDGQDVCWVADIFYPFERDIPFVAVYKANS